MAQTPISVDSPRLSEKTASRIPIALPVIVNKSSKPKLAAPIDKFNSMRRLDAEKECLKSALKQKNFKIKSLEERMNVLRRERLKNLSIIGEVHNLRSLCAKYRQDVVNITKSKGFVEQALKEKTESESNLAKEVAVLKNQLEKMREFVYLRSQNGDVDNQVPQHGSSNALSPLIKKKEEENMDNILLLKNKIENLEKSMLRVSTLDSGTASLLLGEACEDNIALLVNETAANQDTMDRCTRLLTLMDKHKQEAAEKIISCEANRHGQLDRASMVS